MRAGIALGSNIEPRLLFLQSARQHILKLHSGTGPVLCSKVYESAPLDCPEGSAAFLNAVLEIEWICACNALFAEMRTIERALGRPTQHSLNSPRTIDLDLLYFGGMEISNANLTLPHPRLAVRRFVLQPLSDIRPDLVLPTFSQDIQTLLRSAPADQTLSVYSESIN